MMGAIIRILAFVRKELFGVVRQPRLLSSLVVGPFLILALFGLGYQASNHYATILVVPNRAEISTNISDYSSLVQDTFQLVEISKNENEARVKLDNRQVDVVIVVPANALDDIYNGQNAKFPVYYRNLNPLQANYIEYSSYVYASQFDRVILRQAIAATKPQTDQFQNLTNQINTSSTTLDRDMQSGNLADAKIQVQALRTATQLARTSLTTLILPDTNQSNATDQKLLGNQLTANLMQNGVASISADLDNINNKLNALEVGFNRGDANSAQQQANLAGLRPAVQSLAAKAAKVANIPPDVLVEPILSQAKNLVSTPTNYTNFYSPAVIILLLQHVAITLSSLSNVRDRLIGAIEIFRVAPISPFQILTGKFISFMLLLLIVGAVLVALITQVMGVPFINLGGNWPMALAVVAATIYASLGLGFLIAGLSKTESQAVQLAMLLLLGSLFFTGFIVPFNQFNQLVQYIGYAIPMTFGATSLQNVMLDNRPLDLFYLVMPIAIGTVYLILGRWLYRRQFNIG
jgi:ABC-2 type transport system permease protein